MLLDPVPCIDTFMTHDDALSLHDTKRLYRRLDGLLAEIVEQTAGHRLLEVYVQRLWRDFAEDLGLRALRVYRERRSSFVLEIHFGEDDDSVLSSIDSSAAWVTNAFEQRVVLVEPARSPVASFPFGRSAASPHAIVSIDEPRQRHLLLFAFHPDWQRESVEFALNTARSALIARLFEQRLGATVREAAAIQESLLPSHPPSFRGYDIAGRSLAAEEVGGDFFDFLALDEDSMGLSIGDASGHGLPAALVARDVVVALRMGVERELKIRHTLRKLNRVVHSSNLTSGFVSLFYGELEDNGNLFFINAGHEPPLLVVGDEHRFLRRGGPVLGPLPDAEFKSHFVHIDREATLIMYTDGIIERRNREGDFFGCEGLSAAVRAATVESSHDLVEHVFKSADVFGQGAQWDDDATIVVVRRLPVGAAAVEDLAASMRTQSSLFDELQTS